MKLAILAFLTILCFTPVQVQADDKREADITYLQMAEKALTMPADFDFKAVRELYPKTSFYSPIGEHAYKKELFVLLDKAKQGDQSALTEAKKLAVRNFAHFKVHSYMASSGILPESENQFHVWALKGIAKSMIDGKSAATPEEAIKVLDVSEEYFLLRTYFHSKAQKKQSTLENGGKVYDVMVYTDENGTETIAYFDVTTPFAAYPVSEPKKP